MWFLFALLGAFGKSYSGLFRKQLANNISTEMFLWFTSSVILILLSPFIILRSNEVINALSQSPLILFGASLALMIATLMNLEALKREDLSYIAPLNAFVPIFTLLVAFIFLNEKPPSLGFFGIILIFIGAYIISLKADKVSWLDPIKHLLTNTGAILSIGVAFFYAVNTVLFKQATNMGYNELTILFCTMLISWVLLLYVPLTKSKELKQTFKSSKVVIAGATISSFVGSFFHILAISGTYASYAVSVRRFDSIISVILGWKHLNETNIKTKLIGSFIMTIGAIVLVIY